MIQNLTVKNEEVKEERMEDLEDGRSAMPLGLARECSSTRMRKGRAGPLPRSTSCMPQISVILNFC